MTSSRVMMMSFRSCDLFAAVSLQNTKNGGKIPKMVGKPKNGGKSKAMHMMTNKTRQLPQVDYLFVIAVHGHPYFYVLHIFIHL